MPVKPCKVVLGGCTDVDGVEFRKVHVFETRKKGQNIY